MKLIQKLTWYFQNRCTKCGGKLTEMGYYPKERKQKCTVCGKWE